MSIAECREVLRNAGLANDVSLTLARKANAEIIALMVAKSAVFGVDLLNTGHLSSWANRDLPAGYSIVAPSEDVPREAPRKDGKQFRISISLDD